MAETGPARSGGAGPANALSIQQRQILELCSTGLGASAIASAMRLTPTDVIANLAHAIQALGARSKLEAIVLASQHGLIAVQRD